MSISDLDPLNTTFVCILPESYISICLFCLRFQFVLIYGPYSVVTCVKLDGFAKSVHTILMALFKAFQYLVVLIN